MSFVASMIAVLKALMMLQAVRIGEISADELMVAIATHLNLYRDAYGEDLLRPKHHYALHLPDMLARFGFLLSTFTHERKHRVVKKYTRDRKNLKSWSLGAIEDVTCHQLWENRSPWFSSCSTSRPKRRALYGLREIFPGIADDRFTVRN